MAKRYRVTLTDEERDRLHDLTRKGQASVRMVRRAQPLLLAAEERCDEEIAKALQIGVATVERPRRRFVAAGLAASLREHARPGARPKLGPKQPADGVGLACTKPPEGRERWTRQRLAERIVALQSVPDSTDAAIRRLLKSTRSSRG